jgi:hypothetical protein
MKSAYWTYWIILLGIFVFGVMLLINSSTNGQTQDYYMVKEVTQASMIDAVDFAYFRIYGDVRMSKEKFVENFVRRYSENISLSNNYDVEFYDIKEVPPKVTVKVSSSSSSYNIANQEHSLDTTNIVNAILEYGVIDDDDNSSSNSAKATCYLDFQPALSTELRRAAKGESSIISSSVFDSLPTALQNWAKGSDNTSKAFKQAILTSYPDLDTKTKFDLLNGKKEYEIWRIAIENKWICSKDIECA